MNIFGREGKGKEVVDKEILCRTNWIYNCFSEKKIVFRPSNNSGISVVIIVYSLSRILKN